MHFVWQMYSCKTFELWTTVHDVCLPTFLVAKIQYLLYRYGTNNFKKELDFEGE